MCLSKYVWSSEINFNTCLTILMLIKLSRCICADTSNSSNSCISLEPSISNGGKILTKNNIIYFLMPNGIIGAVDTLIGEQIKNTITIIVIGIYKTYFINRVL